MRAFVTRKELENWHPVDISLVFDYVKRSDNVDLYIPAEEYFEIYRSCQNKDNHFDSHNIIQGRTSENYPFFMVAGIKITMIPKDKIESLLVLK